jgi:shikimate 5-dehydrogenase
MGSPAAGGPWQFVMERTLAAANLDWRFLTLDVAPTRMVDAIRGADAMGFVGIVMRTTHWNAAAEALEQIATSADGSSIASRPTTPVVDFLYRQDGTWRGEFLLGRVVLELAVKEKPWSERGAIVLGDGRWGDALRAVLQGAGARVADAKALVPPPGCDLLVDARSTPNLAPPDGLLEGLSSHVMVMDVATPNGFSRLTQAAAPRLAISGLDVAVRHATTALQQWTQTTPSPQVLREAFEEFWEI